MAAGHSFEKSSSLYSAASERARPLADSPRTSAQVPKQRPGTGGSGRSGSTEVSICSPGPRNMRARYHGAGSQMRVGDITHSCTRLLTGAAPARRPSLSLSLASHIYRSLPLSSHADEIVRSCYRALTDSHAVRSGSVVGKRERHVKIGARRWTRLIRFVLFFPPNREERAARRSINHETDREQRK